MQCGIRDEILVGCLPAGDSHSLPWGLRGVCVWLQEGLTCLGSLAFLDSSWQPHSDSTAPDHAGCRGFCSHLGAMTFHSPAQKDIPMFNNSPNQTVRKAILTRSHRRGHKFPDSKSIFFKMENSQCSNSSNPHRGGIIKNPNNFETTPKKKVWQLFLQE